ncbi:glycosyltransferase family 4 protein [Formosa maritima]|uniref:Glycosyltransferase family 4 protein n=1 Tax=Formosa maritima TaxID=2592046 RepID=A0A5D0GCM7_9FLAO|nr:glycosyltransferase family 4 protein [Formosa maritima]TYA56645.1 glycosyltransferase family 4 protein [Formosa maritima]
MKIALLTPNKSTYTETFIQNHIDYLPFEKIVVYGGAFPYLMTNEEPSLTYRRWYKYKTIVRDKFGIKTEAFKAHLLKKHLQKHDVDLVFAEYLNTGAEVQEVCKELKIPLVAIALGYEISQYRIIEQYESMYQSLFQYAKKIIVVSNHMKKNLLALHCPENKIVYSPASPSEDFFELQPTFLSKQILAVGRFVNKKAPELTIKAFSKVFLECPEATLVMAGDGPLLEACKMLVEELKLQEAVVFKGRITREEHKQLLAASYMFVQHSRVAENGDSEGTPVAILEASAAGLPVVSTLHAGIPDVIRNNETGFLVKENDVDEMANKMIELLHNKELAIQMGSEGKIYIMENFTLEKHISIIGQAINN